MSNNKIIAGIIFGLVSAAGVAAYKEATKKEADIELTQHDIKSIVADTFCDEAAEGYDLIVMDEMSEDIKKLVFGDKGVSSEGVSSESKPVFAGLTVPSTKTIYVFIEGLIAERELRKKLGKEKSNAEIVRDTVLHECRHSRQFEAMEKKGMDLNKVFAYEGSCGYGKGPMEADAFTYTAFPRAYGFLIRPNLVAKFIKKRIENPVFTAQYNIATMFGK